MNKIIAPLLIFWLSLANLHSQHLIFNITAWSDDSNPPDSIETNGLFEILRYHGGDIITLIPGDGDMRQARFYVKPFDAKGLNPSNPRERPAYNLLVEQYNAMFKIQREQYYSYMQNTWEEIRFSSNNSFVECFRVVCEYLRSSKYSAWSSYLYVDGSRCNYECSFPNLPGFGVHIDNIVTVGIKEERLPVKRKFQFLKAEPALDYLNSVTNRKHGAIKHHCNK